MNNQLLAIIGIIGGLLCAVADCLLDLKGADNEKLGEGKYIDSKWKDMAHWRFVASGILAMFAVPMYTCGFLSLMNQVGTEHSTFALIMKAVFCCGAMGGFMIHSYLCLMPTIYQKIMATDNFALAETVISSTFRQIIVPFVTLYSMLVIFPSIAVIYGIFAGMIALPVWCVIMNPLVFRLIGLLFRATGCKWFIDAPSICAASLGLAMYGVLALMM